MARMTNRYIPGDRWVECDVCGFAYRFSEMRKGVAGKQKGLSVCPTDYDTVHPNEGWKLPFKPEGKLKKVGE